MAAYKLNIRGFTLIELLVVMTIIAILAAVGLTMYGSAQKSARVAKRASDLKAIADALQIYYFQNGNQYPNPGGGWRGECNHPWGTANLPSDQVIPGLVPNYMVAFPKDPKMNATANTNCYLYQSNGTDYKLLDHLITEFTATDYLSQRNLVDPLRDGGTNGCIVDGITPWAWAVYSSVSACW